MLIHSGMLLVKVAGRPYNSLVSAPGALQLSGYQLEPLFKAHQLTPAFSAEAPADHWFLATPSSFSLDNPWDLAHAAARAAGYSFYAEPDLLQENRARFSVAPTARLNKHWPPPGPVSPGWHLLDGFTGFQSAHKTATGKGIRIAHLDTGYSPEHESTPKNVRPELGWDFYSNQPGTVDPGTGGLLNMPGHGTATMALLAGNKMDLTFGGKNFNDYFGGAPESDVVPVRIGPSVIHLFTRTMAQGIDYALAPRGDPKNKCDVVTISHGGLPAASWAAAVNHVYEAGIVVAAASGDNLVTIFGPFPFHETVWPSRFNRVITVVGATYDGDPYVTHILGELEGSWGPKSVMDKTIAAYTPNVAWMKFRTESDYDMDGGGTSSSTPQVAAACALWLQLHGKGYPANWKRVEACRQALFGSAYLADASLKDYLGRGILRVPAMLSRALAEEIQQAVEAVQPLPVDDIEFPLGEQIMAAGPPSTEEEKMYQVEMAQIVYRSANGDLVSEAQAFEPGVRLKAEGANRLRQSLADEPDVSSALKTRLSAIR